jgi:hypothetical protein
MFAKSDVNSGVRSCKVRGVSDMEVEEERKVGGSMSITAAQEAMETKKMVLSHRNDLLNEQNYEGRPTQKQT